MGLDKGLKQAPKRSKLFVRIYDAIRFLTRTMVVPDIVVADAAAAAEKVIVESWKNVNQEAAESKR